MYNRTKLQFRFIRNLLILWSHRLVSIYQRSTQLTPQRQQDDWTRPLIIKVSNTVPLVTLYIHKT